VANDSPSKVLILAPMRSELNPIVRTLSLRRQRRDGVDLFTGRLGRVEVSATTIGVGPAAAARSTERALDAVSVDHVVVCGIAGALRPESKIGELIVPDLVIDGATRAEYRPSGWSGVELRGTLMTVGELITDGPVIDDLRESGVEGLEMEAAAVAEVCASRGRPWTVFRSYSDRVQDAVVDTSVLSLLNEDGSTKPLSAAWLVVSRPQRLPGLVRLARDSGTAARSAAGAVKAALSGG
jgi:adenosylhomocysteine nucleosidase